MMKQYLFIFVILLGLGMVSESRAEKAGKLVATLTADGEAKEVKVDQAVSKILIKCTEGTVIINTIVVRDGETKTPFKIGVKLAKDAVQQITVGNEINCSGLRISDDGKGQYEVRVKK